MVLVIVLLILLGLIELIGKPITGPEITGQA